MAGMSIKKGEIIVPRDSNVWPHEVHTAEALAAIGYTVEFIPCGKQEHENSADAMIGGIKWEFKAPKSGSTKAIERNLKRARWQSSCIVFDSHRMKQIPDVVIERELRKWAIEIRGISRLIFVSRSRKVIDIL